LEGILQPIARIGQRLFVATWAARQPIPSTHAPEITIASACAASTEDFV
jgi:hypothetical protein